MKTLFSLFVSTVIVAIVGGIVLATAQPVKASGYGYSLRCAPAVSYAVPVSSYAVAAPLAAPVCDCEPAFSIQSYAAPAFAAPVYSSLRVASYPRFASRAVVVNRVGFANRHPFVNLGFRNRAVFLDRGNSLLNVNLGGRRGLVNFGGVGRRGGLNLRLR